uniref:Uncharacterized protein n=1 Tax=viral metagenome TaxID=1070528 RepID=A0A6C0DDR6_9ZZZZ
MATASASVNPTYSVDICTQNGEVIDAKEIKKLKDSLWGFRLDKIMENDGGPFKHLFPPNKFISSSQSDSDLVFRITNNGGRYIPVITVKMNQDNKGFRIIFTKLRSSITKENVDAFVDTYITWLNGQKTSRNRNPNSNTMTILGTYKLCNSSGGSRKHLRKTKRNKKSKRRTRRS